MKTAFSNINIARRRALKSLFLHEMQDVRNLGVLIEKLLKKEVQSLSEIITEKTSSLPLPECDELAGWYDADIDQLSCEFPRIQRYALFTTAMGTIESHLQFLCKHAQQVCDNQIGVNDLNGKGAIRAMTYLTKVCRFRIATGRGSQVEHLTMMQKIRNAIVHNGGTPPDSDVNAIRQYRKSCPHFDLSPRNQVRPHEAFLEIVIHIGELLFTTIIAEIEKAERRAQQSGGEVRG